jgi:hypothetical protein
VGQGDESERIADLARESIAPIEQELRHRLLAEVGEGDLLAIESALLKAFLNGMRTRASETAQRVIDESGVATSFGPTSPGGAHQILTAAELDPPLPWLDPWADRQGGNG